MLKWSVVVLGGGIAALLIWLTVFFDPNDYREHIAEGISEATGLHFTIEGSVRLSLRFEPGEACCKNTVENAGWEVGELNAAACATQSSDISFPLTQSTQLAGGRLVDGTGQFRISNLDLSVAVGLGLDPTSFNGSMVDSVLAQGSFEIGETLSH